MNGDHFRKIFTEHQQAIYQFAWRLTGSPSMAEDIAQDVFVLVLRGETKPEMTRGSWRPFLLGIARHFAWRRFRKESRWSPLDEDELVTAPLKPELMDAQDAVSRAVAALPALQREVLVLATYDGLSLQELADLLEVEVGTVKGRLHRARENLKRMLAEYRPVGARSETNRGTHE